MVSKEVEGRRKPPAGKPVVPKDLHSKGDNVSVKPTVKKPDENRPEAEEAKKIEEKRLSAEAVKEATEAHVNAK